MSGPSLEHLAQIRASAHAELEAKPTVSRWWTAMAALLFLEFVAAAVGVAKGRAGLIGNRSPAVQLWAIAGLVGLALLFSALAAFSPRRGSVSGWGVGVGALALLLVLGGSGLPGNPSVVAGAVGCGRFLLGVALVPSALALVFLTRFAPDPGRALQAGFSAAAAGLLALHLHCPDGTAPHLLLGHLLPAVALAATVVLLRRRLPSRSYAP